jgi:hypothetical protein
MYFGPDRRRRQIDWKGPERRKNASGQVANSIPTLDVDRGNAGGKPSKKANAEPETNNDAGLSQAEVEALLGN